MLCTTEDAADDEKDEFHSRNQIDHAAINRRWRSSLVDVRAIRGGDIASRNDKKTFLEDKTSEAQEATSRGDTQTLYRITRGSTRTSSSQPSTVKDEPGKLITKLENQCSRWANHFQTILNRPYPKRAAYIEGKGKEMEMKKGPITCLEIGKASAKSKSNRAPGEDRITTGMLKADPSMSANCLVSLLNKVWTEEKVPDA
ncbi:endonuclease-reverse transcriptase [Elysia marginata]|uniref:Endonuclease-reverse transcriptase n=1 Tax=Elysia marginata TaxID=1093978 RepID=A0AAV4JVX1_9GAST|nr:endonuclease-reverse transcriptase [Elysia marginata]